MAQTAPPGEGIPRPLPRGSRPIRSRDTRPRFQPLDALWLTVLAVVFAGATFPAWKANSQSTFCLFCGIGAVVLTYLTGWRAAGRSAGVISGLLLATSGTFASSVFRAPQTDLFALISLGALFAFIAGSSLAALVLAAGAVWLRADGLALGLMLLTFTLIQHRRRALWGTLLFLLPALAAVIVPHTERGGSFASLTLGFHPALMNVLAAPATLVVSWFLLPFFGEMADPVRRARWLPVVTWTTLYAVLASVVSFGSKNDDALVPFLPLLFLMAGAGMARLLPAMTGDLPIPWLRYIVATLAVLSLAAIRARVERLPTHQAPSTPLAAVVPAQTFPVSPPAPTNPAPIPKTAAMPFVSRPAMTPKPLKPSPVRPASLPKAGKLIKPAKPQGIKPKIVKPAVPQYVMRNGRLVRRSKWAIQWDLTHPGP